MTVLIVEGCKQTTFGDGKNVAVGAGKITAVMGDVVETQPLGFVTTRVRFFVPAVVQARLCGPAPEGGVTHPSQLQL